MLMIIMYTLLLLKSRPVHGQQRPQYVGVCSALRVFEQGRIFIVLQLLVTRVLGFTGLI
jgi:hypothetical protein